jgi:hypothetical protein
MKRMRRIIVACLTVLSLLLCFVSSLSAQSSAKQATGQIKGAVMDVQDGRVTDAVIKIVGKDFKWTGITNSEGEFTADIPTGTYHIYAMASGFRKFESASLKVKSNVIELVNIHLDIAPTSGPIKVVP